MFRYVRWLFYFLLILLAGCAERIGTENTPTAAEEVPVPVSIECTAAYRASVTVGIESETSVVLAQENPTANIPFADLTFHAEYLDPTPYEIRSLRLWVTESEGERQITNVLYQLSNSQKLVNMTAGHGFTGLNYVYHPSSGAELQYWCTAR